MINNQLELYVHIPFCVKKCAYCDFLSFVACEDVYEQYVDALCTEIQSLADPDSEIRSVFIGGGTPSILLPGQIEKILQTLQESFSISKTAEFTIEANPGTMTKEKAMVWLAGGINRISMGIQALDNTLLKRIGRIHTVQEAIDQYEMLRACGFSNVSFDLMSALPHQTVEHWQNTLKKAVALQPEHLSCYSLIIEEGTPFYHQLEEGLLHLPSEDDERMMYNWTKEFLSLHGFSQYEISNYSKAGYESKHNIGYWERIPYLGFGLGASSLVKNKEEWRYKNTTDMQYYLQYASQPKRIQQEREILSLRECMEEFIFLGLRMNRGISSETFLEYFHQSLESVYGTVILKQIERGLLENEEGYLRLTDRGRDFANQVFVEFLQ